MIRFKTLTFKNILSVGNQPVTINLDDKKTTLIHGANGSGKSTILDALTYALFGKSFRGVNLTQLVNSQNKKGLLVECEFSIGKDTFLVRRGMKPKVFETFKNEEFIDKKAADKDNQAHLEQNILKLTYKSFTQIVILGSSNFVPFMQLNSAGRRECVEDFLDIKVFSAMATIAKERLRGRKEQVRILDAELSALEFKIETLQDKIREMSQRDDAEIEAVQTKKSELKHRELQLIESLKVWNQDIEFHQTLIDVASTKDPVKAHRKLNDVIIQLNTKLQRLVKEREFFDQDECPTCGQGIEFAVKTSRQGAIQKEIDEVDKATIQATKMMNLQSAAVEELQELNAKMSEFNSKVFELQTELRMCQSGILDCDKSLNILQSFSSDIEREEDILTSLNEDLKQLRSKKAQAVGESQNLDTVVHLLKDSGIKTQIVKKYLPAMNKFTRKNLEALDFPIHFSLDSEFNEQVHSPMHQNYTYSSFSEGQKGRIDLALMFTWREIGRLKNSVTTNLLILDEVFSSSLDETGKECLLKLLRYDLPNDQRVVVVDHTLGSTFRDKFDTSVEVTRKGGFSRYD